MSKKLRVLIVEDSEDDAELSLRELRSGGYEPLSERVDTHKAMADALKKKTWDIVISDYSMPHFNGFEALKLLRKSGLDIPLIVVSGKIGEEIAVELMKGGANDYVMKGNLKRLAPAIERELNDAETRRERKKADAALRIKNLVFDATIAANSISDMSGNIIEANEAFLSLWGYPNKDEVIGKPLPHFFQKSEEAVTVLTALNKSGRWTGEFSARRKDGSMFTAYGLATDIKDSTGEVISYQSSVTDITERKKGEEALIKNQKRIQALLSLFQLTLPAEEAIVASAVKEIIDLTGSRLGFIGFVDELETVMFAHLWSEKAMQGCAIDNKPVQFSIKEGGLWTAAVIQKQPLIINDYLQPDPRKKGYPAGHVPLDRFMGIPVMQDGHVVMVAGLANKAGDYDEADRQQASLLLEGVWSVIKRKRTEEKLLKSYESVKKTLNDAINTIVKIMETRDPYTAGHQHKVADLAVAIAIEMEFDDIQIDQLKTAAVIHDIGKMYVPSDILSKPGKLSVMEFSLIKTHAQAGFDIVKGMDFPGAIAETVLQHHERLDGSGYPNGLKGEDTLMKAKILAVADVVEAMASHRPYRPALGIDKAIEEISNNRGKLYDPAVVDACLKLFTEKGYKFKE